MDNITKTRILSGITEASVIVHETSKTFGYWKQDRTDLELLHLIGLENEEAVQFALTGQQYDRSKIIEFSNLEEELADVIIRALDIARGRGLSIGPALIAKMEHNQAMANVGDFHAQ